MMIKYFHIEANKMNFKNKTITQIRLWAWAAVVLPITALAGTFFTWRFFDGGFLSLVMITGETIVFAIAVIWWWWAMFTMRNLVKQWDETRDKVKDVSNDIKEIRSAILETLSKDK